MREKLIDVGKLAAFGEDYTRTHEEVLRLLWDCERGRSFLKQNRIACGDARNADYDACWRVIDAIWVSVAARRDPVLRVLDDRANWLNETDRAQSEQRLKDWALAFERASSHIGAKAAGDALHELDTLVNELERVEHVLNRSLYDGVFQSLRELAAH